MAVLSYWVPTYAIPSSPCSRLYSTKAPRVTALSLVLPCTPPHVSVLLGVKSIRRPSLKWEMFFPFLEQVSFRCLEAQLLLANPFEMPDHGVTWLDRDVVIRAKGDGCFLQEVVGKDVAVGSQRLPWSIEEKK